MSTTLAPDSTDTSSWFFSFVAVVEHAAREAKSLPVCRLSDGEFTVLFGTPPPSLRRSMHERAFIRARTWFSAIRRRGALRATTRPGISSGSYSRVELRQVRAQSSRQFADIARQGIVAVHLSYGPVPFVEHFFPPFRAWLDQQGLQLRLDNYVPFYFVYAFLALHLRALIAGRRVGIVHSASGAKRERIERHLVGNGAAEVVWQEISPDSSAFDEVSLAGFSGCHVILIGAGVGKANIFRQLSGFPGPYIDAGFMFEVWSDPTVAAERPFCVPDSG